MRRSVFVLRVLHAHTQMQMYTLVVACRKLLLRARCLLL